jgi:type I restriction enzyme S subunit
MLSARNVLNGQIIFDGFRFIDSDAFEFEDGRTGVRPGDVLVTIVGTIGRSAVVPEGTEPFVLQRSVAVLRPIGFSPRLLMYLLQAPQTQKELQRLSRGTAQKGVYLKSLAQVGLRIPPLKEGERIVAEIEKQFTRLEAAVAALRRVQANLKRYRAALLKAAIQGRLVPTEAEFARHEGRSYEPASELLKRILAERRPRWEADQFARLRASGKERKDGNRKARYKDPACPDTTNAPVLPDGWTWAAVGQVSRLVQYGSSAKTTEESNGVPVLRMINIMSDGRLNLKDLKYLPPYHKEFPDLLLQTGDLLFNRTNSPELVGKSAVYNGTPSPCSFASYLIRVRTMEGCSPTFLAFCLNSAWGRSWIKSVVSQQVGQANVNGSKLQGFVFPLPPWGEQRRIVAETERRLSVMDELEMQLEANLKRAERLRQAILNRAFEGKLVPQDPNDEPASVLLERIRAERDNRQASPSLKRRRLTEAIRKIRGQHAEPNSL